MLNAEEAPTDDELYVVLTNRLRQLLSAAETTVEEINERIGGTDRNKSPAGKPDATRDKPRELREVDRVASVDPSASSNRVQDRNAPHDRAKDRNAPRDRSGTRISVGDRVRLLTTGRYRSSVGVVTKINRINVSLDIGEGKSTTRAFHNIQIINA